MADFRIWSDEFPANGFMTHAQEFDQQAFGGSGENMSRSMEARKAASVFPEPVGAWISVCSPVAIAGQPSTCAGVGSENVRSNHVRVSGLKGASGSTHPA